MDTTEGNKLIAEFMGANIEDMATGNKFTFPNGSMMIDRHIEYDSSWDWLMPVVEKIEGLNFGIKIYKNSCWVTNYPESNTCAASSKIESVWLAVVEFIEWYNENK